MLRRGTIYSVVFEIIPALTDAADAYATKQSAQSRLHFDSFSEGT